MVKTLKIFKNVQVLQCLNANTIGNVEKLQAETLAVHNVKYSNFFIAALLNFLVKNRYWLQVQPFFNRLKKAFTFPIMHNY